MNKTYNIKARNLHEEVMVRHILNTLNVSNKQEKSVLGYERFSFECKKSTWKKIKEELNLEITSVYSQIREES
jgi:hypothetical protein